MKRFFILLLFTISLFPLSAQTDCRVNVIETLYYSRGAYIASEGERAKLNSLIEQMKADSTLKIHIIGYGDRWGGKEVNDRFSHVRAMYIAEWMRSCRVPSEQISFVGEGIDSEALSDAEARRVEVSQIVETIMTPQPQEEAAATETEDVPAPEPTEDVDAEVVAEPEPEPEIEAEIEPQTPTIPEQESQPNIFSLRTNLLYWLCGIMNIGAEYRFPESNFGVVLNGGYAPLGNSDWEHNFGGWFVAPEFRYYLPRNEHWFVGAQLLASGYNVKLSDTGYQGTVIGGGVVGGYKLTLTDLFDMDFTLGAGYGHFKYDTYYHDEPTSTNPYIEKGVSKNSIVPIQVGVNLIWKIK